MQALKTKALEDGSLKGLPGGVEKNNKGGGMSILSDRLVFEICAGLK